MLLAVVALVAGACTGSGDGARPTGPPSREPQGVRHVVVDTDLAFEDVFALLYLLQRDDVAIDAVTIAGTGEAHCDPGVSNALGILALGGETDVPVACGRETPLRGSNAFPQEWRDAADDLSMANLPATDGEPDPRGAPELLIDTLDDDATLITLGPLTNVAEALRADPGLPNRVPRTISMAGAIDVGGNAPGGAAEFNVWADPLAAKEVVEGMDVTLVPLDATNDVPYTSFFSETLKANLDTPEARAVDAIISANEEIFADSSFWDTLATTLTFRPELATWGRAKVLVTDSLDAGAGWIDRWDDGVPVRFANAVPDPLAFEREFLSVIAGRTITRVRPAPTMTIAFDGERCSVRPDEVRLGRQVVAFEGGGPKSGAVLVELSDAFTYDDLRAFLGPDGSPPPEGRPPADIEVLAFAGPDLAEAETTGPPVVGVCFLQQRSGRPVGAWLSRPVRVSD